MENTLNKKLINNDNRFISILVKSCLWYLTNNITLYNKSLKHIIVNTGDEYMYLEAQNFKYIPGMQTSQYGYKLDTHGNCLPCQNYTYNNTLNLIDNSKVTGEDHVYFEIPRGNVEFSSVSIQTDEITAPYSRGIFEENNNEQLQQFSAEFRRLPITIDLKITYYLDSFNDVLILTEKLLSHFAFVKYFYITYKGREIICSLTFPEAVEHEKMTTLDFDTENRNKKIELTLTLDSSMPIINEQTKIETNKVISGFIVTQKSGSQQDILLDNNKTSINYNTPPILESIEKIIINTPEDPYQN